MIQKIKNFDFATEVDMIETFESDNPLENAYLKSIQNSKESYNYHLKAANELISSIDESEYSLECIEDSLYFQYEVINELSPLTTSSEGISLYQKIVNQVNIPMSFEAFGKKTSAGTNKFFEVMKKAWMKFKAILANIITAIRKFLAKITDRLFNRKKDVEEALLRDKSLKNKMIKLYGASKEKILNLDRNKVVEMITKGSNALVYGSQVLNQRLYDIETASRFSLTRKADYNIFSRMKDAAYDIVGAGNEYVKDQFIKDGSYIGKAVFGSSPGYYQYAVGAAIKMLPIELLGKDKLAKLNKLSESLSKFNKPISKGTHLMNVINNMKNDLNAAGKLGFFKKLKLIKELLKFYLGTGSNIFSAVTKTYASIKILYSFVLTPPKVDNRTDEDKLDNYRQMGGF